MRRGPSPQPHEGAGSRANEAGEVRLPRCESGVLRKEELDPDLHAGPPPWAVVNAYVTRGEHRAWVDAHAARSPAFAEVLAALMQDEEERSGPGGS